MIKLYSSAIHPRRWVAYVQGEGWVVFPIVDNGWVARVPARGLDPMHLREVPLGMGSQAGVPLPQRSEMRGGRLSLPPLTQMAQAQTAHTRSS